MLITPHLLAGAALGGLMNNPVVAFGLGLASHFVLDAIPHFEQGTYRAGLAPNLKPEEVQIKTIDYVLAGLDFIIGIFILYFFLKNNFFTHQNIIFGAAGAFLPDLIDNVPFWNKVLRPLPFFKQLHRFHNGIHFNLKVKYWYWGVLTQVLVIGGSLWVLLNSLSS